MPQITRLSDHEPLAKICSAFILELFAPEYVFDSLPYFIAMALSQSQLPDANALAALTLLHRLKSQHPTYRIPVKSYDAERLFLASYIAATKALSDDRHRLHFWVLVGQNKFSADEIIQIEKEFLEDIAWDTRIDDATLAIYHVLVERQKGEISRTNPIESNAGLLSSTTSSTSSAPVTVGSVSLRVKQSEHNLASLDQRIQELQHKYDSLLSNGTCYSNPKSPRTRYVIKEKLRHAFRL